MMKRIFRLLASQCALAVSVLAIQAPFATADNCDDFFEHLRYGQELYQSGAFAEAKREFIAASDYDDCGDESYYWENMAEGRKRFERKHFKFAENSFNAAYRQATTSAQKSQAIARLGQSQIAQVGPGGFADIGAVGQTVLLKGIQNLRLANQTSDQPMGWVEDLMHRVEIDYLSDVSEKLLSRNLEVKRPTVVDYTLSGEPVIESLHTVDVRILFEHDDYQIPASYRPAIRIIRNEMSLPENLTKSYTLIGHASLPGPSDHNWQLSYNRAQSVRDALVELDRSLEQRLFVEGRGESVPLYRVETNAKHQKLNRRIQIVVRQ